MRACYTRNKQIPAIRSNIIWIGTYMHVLHLYIWCIDQNEKLSQILSLDIMFICIVYDGAFMVTMLKGKRINHFSFLSTAYKGSFWFCLLHMMQNSRTIQVVVVYIFKKAMRGTFGNAFENQKYHHQVFRGYSLFSYCFANGIRFHIYIRMIFQGSVFSVVISSFSGQIHIKFILFNGNLVEVSKWHLIVRKFLFRLNLLRK